MGWVSVSECQSPEAEPELQNYLGYIHLLHLLSFSLSFSNRSPYLCCKMVRLFLYLRALPVGCHETSFHPRFLFSLFFFFIFFLIFARFNRFLCFSRMKLYWLLGNSKELLMDVWIISLSFPPPLWCIVDWQMRFMLRVWWVGFQVFFFFFGYWIGNSVGFIS